MTFIDRLMAAWDWLMHALGLDRVNRDVRETEMEGHSLAWKIFYFGRPLLVVLVILYLGVLTWRFGFTRGAEMTMPAMVLEQSTGALISANEETEPESGQTQAKTCARSRTVDMQIAMIDMLVDQNDWAPATPMYTIGFFWLAEWEATPWFDNKASFQSGALQAVRRMGVELNDTLGRVRGTSSEDQDLAAAQGKLRVNEAQWIFNSPFNTQVNTVATSAGSSYGAAADNYRAYNDRLEGCDALFDARADNLRVVLDRVAKDVGSLTDQLAKRSQGERYDPASDTFVDGEGNDRGWFDFRADNLFHRARGQMYALHGLLQAMRVDFSEVIDRRDLADVWDRMEAHVAEAAVLSPLIVSNGREDGLFMPDHLSAMAENMLRARANMTELRDILDR